MDTNHMFTTERGAVERGATHTAVLYLGERQGHFDEITHYVYIHEDGTLREVGYRGPCGWCCFKEHRVWAEETAKGYRVRRIDG